MARDGGSDPMDCDGILDLGALKFVLSLVTINSSSSNHIIFCSPVLAGSALLLTIERTHTWPLYFSINTKCSCGVLLIDTEGGGLAS